MTMSTTLFSFRIDTALKTKLDALAVATKRSKSFLAVEALENYLERESWHVAHVQKAIDEMKDDVGVPHEEVEAWPASLGTKNELPTPKARKLR